MPFCPVIPPYVTPGCAADAVPGLPGQAGMVAVRVADLASPAGRAPGKDGRSALTAAGAGRIRAGDVVVFCKPVAVAPAVVRRDGRVQAAGHPADHARLGWPGAVRRAVLDGRGDLRAGPAGNPAGEGHGGGTAGDDGRAGDPVGPADDADGCGLRRGDGSLAQGPGGGAVAAPVSAADRDGGLHLAGAIGPVPLEKLRDLLLAGIDAEHRDHDYRAVTVGTWMSARPTGR